MECSRAVSLSTRSLKLSSSRFSAFSRRYVSSPTVIFLVATPHTYVSVYVTIGENSVAPSGPEGI
jgi:hypothetical protein